MEYSLNCIISTIQLRLLYMINLRVSALVLIYVRMSIFIFIVRRSLEKSCEF